MYIKKINPYNLKVNDIDKKVTRVKILILNNNNEILLCNVDGKYTYIGGHVEKDESLSYALNRDIVEETIFELGMNNFNPFLKIENYDKNHFNSGNKCLSEIYYYFIFINEKADIKKQNLDISEKNRNFFLEYMNIEQFYSYLYYQKNICDSKLHSEMLYALDYFRKNISEGLSNEKKLRKKI